MRPVLAVLLVPAAALAQTAPKPVTVPPPLPVLTMPVPPPVMALTPMSGEPDVVAKHFKAGEEWKNGDPQKVVAAFEKAGVDTGGRLSEERRDFVEEWILALTYADPAKAQAKLAGWEKSDPVDPLTVWGGKRLVLQTRILLAQGKAAEAETQLALARNLLATMQTNMAETEKANRKEKRRPAYSYTDFERLSRFDDSLKLASFLMDTAREGDKAFPRYAAVATSPFANSEAMLTTLQATSLTFCASSGLRQDDWAVLDVVFDRQAKTTRVMPVAQSRAEVLKPMLEDVWEWGFTFRSARMHIIHAPMLVRCANGAPTAANDRTARAYLWDKFKPLTQDMPKDFQFDKFRQPPAELASKGQWTWLVNLASYPDPLVPGLQRGAQLELAKKLESETPKDENAVDMLRFLQLRTVNTGDIRSAKAALPDYVALVEELRKKAKLPARELASMELRVADLHEIAGDGAAATPYYESIMARPDDVLPAKSPEAIKARLRMAALAEAAGNQKKADAVIAQLGMTPEQCSMYQARPAITKFSMPSYPSDAMRNENQGYVSFEFDMDKAGKPTNFRILASAPPLIFDRRTVTSFSAAEFAPATRGGSALACEAARTSFVWKIED